MANDADADTRFIERECQKMGILREASPTA